MAANEPADNPRAVDGNNKPPSSIDIAWSTYQDISAFLSGMPVVQTDDDSRQAKLFFDRAKVTLDAMEADRDGQVRPLNETVREINGSFKKAREPLEKLKDEIAARMRTFVLAEEARRAAIAVEAARVAEKARQVALAAEAAEREAKENAAQGEFTDAGDAIAEADDAFREAQVAGRAAALAQRDVKVKVGGGFGRSFSLRTTETLSVSDAGKALAAIVAKVGSVPPKIAEALLSAARDYRKMFGSLPAGIAVEHGRG
jgi:hypothetical protein